jgi:hypothetical protein
LDSRPSPLRPCSNSLRSEKWGIQTGANISQVFLSASGFLHRFFFLDEASFRKTLLIISRQHRKDALTNFFVLSNIRFVSGGSSEMLRTSRCIRIKLLQSGGPRTLSAVASSLYNLSSPSEKYFASWGQSSPPHCGQLEFIPETMWNPEPIHFRPRPGRGRRGHNLKGDGRRFRWPLINFED